MLEIRTGTARNCEGVNRREFIRVGALTAFGLSLPDLLRAESAASPSAGSAAPGGQGARRDVSVILLWMNGGPPQLDTFDPKPDAPAEIRGEFGSIPTTLPGVRVCELLPRLARRTGLYSMLRSVTSNDNGHETATHYCLTGYRFTPAVDYPSYGSVAARELGGRGDLPPYVLLGGYPFGYGGAGYMGGVYNPFNIDGNPASSGFRVRDVALPKGMVPDRLARRRDLLTSLDAFQREVESSEVRAMSSFYEKAYALVTSPRAKRAFDLTLEPPRVRERYGVSHFGQSCLMARRLIEAGVRFVTINWGGWDTHQSNFTSMRSLLPQLDLAYSALLEDLEGRGLLESTLVVWMGEFGRTPKVNPSAGRDHWAQAMTVCMGGGGVRTGVVVGETNERAEEPRSRPIRVEDLAATIYHALGIDASREYITPQNRPVRINYDGVPVSEIL